MNRVFPLMFHCEHTEPIPKSSFVLNGRPYDVPCVYMIWKRKDTERHIPPTIQPKGFRYVKASELHHICVRRVGVYAGNCVKSGTKTCSPSSHYFISLDPLCETKIDTIITTINQCNYVDNTVGPRSISKPEFNEKLNTIIQSVIISSS